MIGGLNWSVYNPYNPSFPNHFFLMNFLSPNLSKTVDDGPNSKGKKKTHLATPLCFSFWYHSATCG